jgi:hypothetical protein
LEELGGGDEPAALGTLLKRSQTIEQRLWVLVGAVNALALSRLTSADFESLVNKLDTGEQIIVLGALLRRLRREVFESDIRSLKSVAAQLARYKGSADLASDDARSVAPWLPEHVWSASAAVSNTIAGFIDELRHQLDERLPPSFLNEEGLPIASRPKATLNVASQALRFDPTRGSSAQRAARRDFQAMVIWSLDEELDQLRRLLRDPSTPPEAWTALWEVGVSRNDKNILAAFDRFVAESWAIDSFVALLLKHVGGLTAPLNLSPETSLVLLAPIKSLVTESQAAVTRPTELSNQVRQSANALRHLRNLLNESVSPVQKWIAQLEGIEEDATQTRR